MEICLSPGGVGREPAQAPTMSLEHCLDREAEGSDVDFWGKDAEGWQFGFIGLVQGSRSRI